MAEAFLAFLSSKKSAKILGRFTRVFSEIDCKQGRPDIVAVRLGAGTRLPVLTEELGHVAACILSKLNLGLPHTLDFLLGRSRYPARTIKECLAVLEQNGLTKTTKNKSFLLSKKGSALSSECWAFELKLAKPKRAIFQAKQMRMYSHRVFIIVPPNQAKPYERFSATMKRWGIGLATFDPRQGEFVLVKMGRERAPLSKEHLIFAVSQCLAPKS